MNYTKELEVAKSVAREMGNIQLKNFRKKLKVLAKSPKDFVTSVDLECQKLSYELLKKEFGPLNEWSEQDTGPKRWSKPFDSNMTEFERKGGKDNVNEGPAYEYANQISKIEKLYDVYWDAVKDLGRVLEKKGQRKLAKELFNNYRK